MNALYEKVGRWIEAVIEKEGEEYTNHEDDSGGPTKFGITEDTLKSLPLDLEVKDLTKEDAIFIYYQEYYHKPKYELLVDIGFDRLAEELFDTGVNMGVRTGIKFLQRTLNVFNNKQKYYDDLKVDGYLGTKTISAIKDLVYIRGASKTEAVLFNSVNSLQAARYIELAENDEKDETFVWGWISKRADFIPF
ncbi:putative secretion activating protein [Pseudoalteromonas phage J2-1_QLiu-2017]|nr:putative secretion activating protein [Pseudoalteromonas phage J2-1_QLiu-2017]